MLRKAVDSVFGDIVEQFVELLRADRAAFEIARRIGHHAESARRFPGPGPVTERIPRQRTAVESFQIEITAEHAAEVEAKGNELKTRLLDVMDRDTDAFNVVSAAFGMPKDTDEQKAERSAAIQNGLKGCTKTPMEMMELIDETLTLAHSLLGRFNDTSASDLGVAFLSLKAGIQGAWLNVLINVGSLKDQEFAAEYRARGEKLLAHALPLADECYAEIVKLIDG